MKVALVLVIASLGLAALANEGGLTEFAVLFAASLITIAVLHWLGAFRPVANLLRKAAAAYGASRGAAQAAHPLTTGFAVLIAGVSIAGALVFVALTQRYDISSAYGGAARVDRLTGTIDYCQSYMVEVSEGERAVRLDCSGMRAVPR